jgi:hypothetical protein
MSRVIFPRPIIREFKYGVSGRLTSVGFSLQPSIDPSRLAHLMALKYSPQAVSVLSISLLLTGAGFCQTTERVSESSQGGQGDAASYGTSISANGRYVAFSSVASNLVIGDRNGEEDIFVRDRKTGVTSLVSVSSLGNQGTSPLCQYQ